MITVKVTGWDGDFFPISVMNLIRSYTGKGLVEGKHYMEKLLHGEAISFALREEALESFLKEARDLHLICETEEQTRE